MTTSNFTITWTDGQFEKSWNANTFESAQEIAKDPIYFPIEISDYVNMTTIISDGNSETVYTYEELKSL